MSIKVIGDKAQTGDHDIKKSQLRRMVHQFRQKPGGGNDTHGNPREITHFAHFPFQRVLQLMVNNQLIKESDTISTVLSNHTIGLKVYFAQHMDKEDCPADFEGYVGRNTVVLVATVFNDQKLWDDVLYEDSLAQNYVVLTGFGDPGTGSDRTNLCPPQCSLFGNTL